MSESRVWSEYQNAIFDFIVHGKGNAIVKAVAGSGKTTTIVHGMSLLPSNANAVFLAFGKAIQTELEKRGVYAKTFHGLCYMPVLRSRGVKIAEPKKMRKILDDNCTQQTWELYGSLLDKLVSLGKQSGVGFLVPDTMDTWMGIVDHHDMQLKHEKATYEKLCELASDVLKESNQSAMVDFDDMLYFAARDDIVLPKFDFVFVDEAQDTNAVQRAILKKIMRPGARMVAVGDPAQAIYGFRGADSESLNMIAKDFSCVELPLTVSYRCPVSVVEYARQWVDHIQHAPGAPVGSVSHLGDKWDPSAFKPSDLVVCRTTAPVISLAYRMLKARMPVHVKGKEIGQGLKALIKRMDTECLDAMITRLYAYMDREISKAMEKQDEAKAERISDKVMSITCLTDGLPEGKRTVSELLAVIDELFADKANATVLSTIHKAKGLEAHRVYWLNSNQCPAQWAKQPWQIEQEVNLCYVASTRAISELITIQIPK